MLCACVSSLCMRTTFWFDIFQNWSSGFAGGFGAKGVGGKEMGMVYVFLGCVNFLPPSNDSRVVMLDCCDAP